MSNISKNKEINQNLHKLRIENFGGIILGLIILWIITVLIISSGIIFILILFGLFFIIDFYNFEPKSETLYLKYIIDKLLMIIGAIYMIITIYFLTTLKEVFEGLGGLMEPYYWVNAIIGVVLIILGIYHRIEKIENLLDKALYFFLELVILIGVLLSVYLLIHISLIALILLLSFFIASLLYILIINNIRSDTYRSPASPLIQSRLIEPSKCPNYQFIISEDDLQQGKCSIYDYSIKE